MREILFRGKTKDNRWVDGFYMFITEEAHIIPVDTHFEYGELLDLEEIIPETLGQFTGLFDRDGIAIFEGDIIECSITYDTGCYPYSKTEIREVKYRRGCFTPLYDIEYNACKIIGNIHDNPELLKSKED